MSTGPAAQFHLRLPDGQAFGPATIEMLEQWARQGRVPLEALLVPLDGSPPQSVLAEPRLRAVLSSMTSMPLATAPPITPDTPAMSPPDSGAAVMIPYKNPPALIGYYTSIAALIPGVGLIAGPAAVILGIVGLRRRLRKPEIHGIAHAWIAIILGGLCTLGQFGCVITGIIGAMSDGR